MDWIDKYISKSERELISEAVALAEKKTTGEILPMIVRSSSRVGHIPLMIFLILWLFILVFEIIFGFFYQISLMSSLSILVLSFPISYYLAKLDWLNRILIPNADEELQVWQRAEVEFYRNKTNETAARVGILIFISILERKAVILADEGIQKKCPPETWSHLVQNMGQKLKQGKWQEGFCQTIEAVGKILSEHFPEQHGHSNDLPNQLIVKL